MLTNFLLLIRSGEIKDHQCLRLILQNFFLSLCRLQEQFSFFWLKVCVDIQVTGPRGETQTLQFLSSSFWEILRLSWARKDIYPIAVQSPLWSTPIKISTETLYREKLMRHLDQTFNVLYWTHSAPAWLNVPSKRQKSWPKKLLFCNQGLVWIKIHKGKIVEICEIRAEAVWLNSRVTPKYQMRTQSICFFQDYSA